MKMILCGDFFGFVLFCEYWENWLVSVVNLKYVEALYAQSVHKGGF